MCPLGGHLSHPFPSTMCYPVLILHSVPSHSMCTSSHHGQQPANDWDGSGGPRLASFSRRPAHCRSWCGFAAGPGNDTQEAASLERQWRKAYLETQRWKSEDGGEGPWGGGGQRSWPFPEVWEDWVPLPVGRFMAGLVTYPFPYMSHMVAGPDIRARERWAKKEREEGRVNLSKLYPGGPNSRLMVQSGET